MVKKVVLAAIVAVLAVSLHIFLPTLKAQLFPPKSGPNPAVATVASLKANLPLHRFLDVIAPVLKYIAKLFAAYTPLEGSRSLSGLKDSAEVSFDKWGGTRALPF